MRVGSTLRHSPAAIARHVGQHAMRVQERVEVAARQVPEPRRRPCHARLHPGAPPCRRVPPPRLQQVGLHPVQRRAHRLVMRPDHPPVAHDQRLQRHRLRRREGQVPAGPVDALALAHPPEPDVRPRHEPRQHALEPLRAHMAPEPQRLRPAPVPEARLPVLRVVLRVVAVPLEIGHRHRGGPQLDERRDHGLRPFLPPRRSCRAGEEWFSGVAAGSTVQQRNGGDDQARDGARRARRNDPPAAPHPVHRRLDLPQ